MTRCSAIWESATAIPRITLFGKNVTPNGHALARRFVTLDNLYCNGEVSEDGHQWCDAAYATDFTEKAWVNSYSKRGQPKATPEAGGVARRLHLG